MTAWLLIILLGLSSAAIWLAVRRITKLEDRLQQEWREQTTKHLQELDTALEEWLGELKLPQLEGETQRKAVAHQLRTVLIEKLLRQRIPG